MTDRQTRLLSLAEAAADGTAVDWAAEIENSHTDEERAVVRRLATIASICAAHRSLHEGLHDEPASSDAAALEAGGTWGKLELKRVIGRGAFGTVWLARDPQLDRDVALKLRAAAPGESAAAIAEGRMLAKLRHPNIVTVHGADYRDGHVGVWMEYLEGETLAEQVDDRGPLGPGEAVNLGLDVCAALAAVHTAGLVHGDIKSQNVMRASGGRVVLMDFSAGVDADDIRSLGSGKIAGTPLFMAPELFDGGRKTVRSDIYSLGVLLFQLLTGRVPVEADDVAGLREAHAVRNVRRLRDLRPDVPRNLAEVVERAIARDSEARYASAGDFEHVLLQIRPARRGRRSAWRLGAVALAAVAVAVAILQQQPETGERRLSNARLVSTFPGSHSEPTLSPDGGMVAFVSRLDGRPSIRVKNLAGGDPIGIVDSFDHVAEPRWSPNQDQILFRSERDIWVVPPLGGGPRKVLEDGLSPGWSKDGSILVFERRDGIFIADTNGRDERRVAGVPAAGLYQCPRRPALSPDGAWIAFFNCPHNPTGDLWIVPSAGGEARRMTFDRQRGGTPVWTHDGKHIVFSSLRRGSMTLWRVGLDGSEPEPVTRGSGEDTEPELSTDGSKLIWTNTRNWFRVKLMDPGSGTRRTLAESRYDVADPVFSPDQQWVAWFAMDNEGDAHIFAKRLGDESTRQITSGRGQRNVHPQWSADGSELYFYRFGVNPSIRSISLDGGVDTEILPTEWLDNERGSVDPLSWFVSGRTLAYTRLQAGTPTETILRRLDSGNETTLPEPLIDAQLSPDGLRVLGVKANREIASCEVDTTDCVTLTPDGVKPHWSSDGAAVFYLSQTSATSWELHRFDRVEGVSELVTVLEPMHPIGDLYDVTRDGRITYVEFEQGRSELWLGDYLPE